MLTKAELQRLRSLRDKKNREALGLFVIEGEKVIGELIAAGYPFETVYATDAWKEPTASNDALPSSRRTTRERSLTQIKLVRLTAEEMTRASHFPTPSSVLAVGRVQRPSLEPSTLSHGLTLALDGVQDAGNVGTLLRIADWFACDRVLLSPDCADVFHQKVINASMGSFARVRVYTLDLAAALATAATHAPKLPILGCDLSGDNVHTLPPLRDGIIVIGSEGRGLSSPVAARLTRRITIPRYGHAESLNAAIAAAIVCDQIRRSG